MWRNKRIGVAVYPRQSGKDVAMGMEMVSGLLRTPKMTGVYVAPDTPAESLGRSRSCPRECLAQQEYRAPRRHRSS